MKKLFLIQDNDRSMHVVADDWRHALERWRTLVLSENEDSMTGDDCEPDGIALVASESKTFTDLLL